MGPAAEGGRHGYHITAHQQIVRRKARHTGRVPHDPERELHHAAGPVGLRQDDASPDDRRAGDAGRGRDLSRQPMRLLRGAGRLGPAGGARTGLRLSGFRPVAAHDGLREYGVRPARVRPDGASRGAGAAGALHRASGGTDGPLPAPALRRAAAARGVRPGGGDGAGVHSLRRGSSASW